MEFQVKANPFSTIEVGSEFYAVEFNSRPTRLRESDKKFWPGSSLTPAPRACKSHRNGYVTQT